LGFTEKKCHHDKWLLDYLVDVRFILGNKGAGFQFFLFKFMDLACVLPGLQTCKKKFDARTEQAILQVPRNISKAKFKAFWLS